MITSRLWTILDEIYYAATRAFHEFVPPPANQELLTWKTAPNALAFLIPYFFMAYLVRRKNTRLIRMLLLPTLIAMALRCTYRYRCEDPRFGWFDWDRGLGCWTCIAKSLDFAFVGDGRFKVGEKQLRRSNDPARPRTRGSSSESDETHDDNSILGRLPACLVDALEVGLTLRGIGWDFGHSLYVPKSTRPSERQAFIKSTIFVVIRNFLIVDVCDTIIKLVPGITPMGETIFLPSLPFFLRYTVSTALHIVIGITIMSGIEMYYDIVTLVAVILLNQPPALWPPIQDNPWKTRSLHELWAKRWHQGLRHTFLTLGGYPGQWLMGDLGMVIGAFLASGLFHEAGLYILGRGMDHRVTLFFLLQAFGIIVEKLFSKLTGRKTGGVIGTSWAILNVVGFGQMCTDAWFARGIGGGVVVPPNLSPIRMILLPAIRIAVM